ncbi:MAG: helix-turn-helix domain-containing protein [Gammaproteobacteria bacterium]|nr:helix-turn-helix domain-containing protein [Gammaproteobacteria bacterium]
MLTAAQVADLLSMNVQEVRRLAREGTLPSRRIGKAYRFFRDEVVAWLNSATG